MRSATCDRVGVVVDVLAEDDELVAAEAGHGVAGAQRVAAAARATCDEHLVAGLVAEAVVDRP